MKFGQFVIGPPGSGKTTYCKAMAEMLNGMGRKVAIVNIDPANDVLPYEANVDISDLITVEQVMEHERLGPNGGLVYCMEYLESNLDWLFEQLEAHQGCYFLIDCPGQVELYTHHNSIRNIFSSFSKKDFSCAAVHLVDSFYCSDPGKFIAVLLTSLSTMMQVEMPHINVLSKCDMIEQCGKLDFNLDFYTEVLDLTNLLQCLSDDPILSRYKKLNEAIAGVIEDYSLVSFLPMSIESKESVGRVLKAVDKANGFILGVNEEQRNIQALLSCAMSADFEDAKISEIAEKYIDRSSQHSKNYISLGR